MGTNDVLETIKSRRSIRKFKAELPSEEVLNKVLEAGVYAPSGMNRQPVLIISVTNRVVRDKIAKANAAIGGWGDGFDPFYGAPVILVVLARKEIGTRVYDGSLAMENMMLEAHALGLGSCWIHRAKEEFELPEWQSWLRSLGIQGNYEGIGHLAVGYPDGDIPSAPARKNEAIVYIR